MKDQCQDFRSLLPSLKMETIFDVGANVGQTVRVLRKSYRRANILAFEPVKSTFEALRTSVGEDPRTQCFQMALGDVQATAKMEAAPGSVRNKVLSGASGALTNEQIVDVDAGDHFCAERGIDAINFLKIDTEGYDLKVCVGFAGMLRQHKIDLVQVEAGLHPKNSLHVPFQAFKDYLEPLGYCIFRIYDQAGQPFARRCNIVFVSPLAAQLNPRPQVVTRPSKSWL